MKNKKKFIHKLQVALLAGMLAFPVCLPNTAAFAAEETEVYGYYQILDDINVRSGPGTDYSVLCQISKGTVVPVMTLTGDWAEISYNGTNGWVNIGFINRTDESAVSSDTQDTTDAQDTTSTDETGVDSSTDTTGSDTTGAETSGSDFYGYSTGEYAASSSGTSLYESPYYGSAYVSTTESDSSTESTEGQTESTDGQTESTDVQSESTDVQMDSAEGQTESADTQTENSDSQTTDTNPAAAAAIAGRVLTLYSGSYFYVTEIYDGNWGKVSWNGKEMWVNLENASFLSSEASSGEPGWSNNGGTWQYYGEDGLLMYSSNSLYEECQSVQGCYSGSGYYMVVNRSTCETVILTGDGSTWSPYIYWSCCTGREGHETITGTYYISDKGYSFGEPEYSCYYYTEIAPKYLFHSIIY